MRARLFFRGEGAVFLGALSIEGLGPLAQAVHDYLKSEGASFTADIQAGLRLTAAELNSALGDLIAAGLITNDSFEALRQASSAGPAHDREPLSPLEEELAARLGPRPLTRGRYREAKRRVTRRTRTEAPASQAAWNGRWALVSRASMLGPALSDEERAEKAVRVLLARYGVVTRDCLDREAGDWEWAQLYPILNRLEMRGEVRRGYFVSGLSGVQFALPEAVEKLRETSDETVLVLSAMDPANVFGGSMSEALSFARVPSTHIVLAGGRPVVGFEDSGQRITTASDAAPEVIERAVQAYLVRPNAPSRVVVTEWNGERVSKGAGQALLKSLGFQSTPTGMEWWAGAGTMTS
jgi:ATP-dependent Lhr-like helicase